MGLRPGDELSIVAAGKDAIAVAKSERRNAAFYNVAALKRELPADYEFDRDEANSR